jgi:hypothetical protein
VRVLNRFLQRLLDVALRVFSLVCRRKLGMSLWKRLPLSVLQNSAIVVDDPVAGCARTGAGTIAAARSGEADISIGADRPSSIVRPESVNNNSAKKEMASRPAAAAPPSRPVQVGRRQSALESAPPRARA